MMMTTMRMMVAIRIMTMLATMITITVNITQEHADLFRTNAIDGQELVSLDNQTLVDLGVAALGHRNKIMRGLQKVNNKTDDD